MTVDLERRLTDLGDWLDLAAPEVTVAEIARAERPSGSPPPADADGEPVMTMPSPADRHRFMATRGRFVTVAAVAVVLVTAGLVAASRRAGGPVGNERPDGPAPSATTLVTPATTGPAADQPAPSLSIAAMVPTTGSCVSTAAGCTTTTAVAIPPPPLVAALVLSGDEVALLDAARQRSMATCMGAEGLTFTTAPYAGADFGMGFLGEWFGEGLTVASAAAHGYQQTVPPYDEAAAARYERAGAANTARVRADATYERAVERCALATVDAINGIGSDDFSTLQNSALDALITVLRPAVDAPAYIDALAAWRACARAAGLTDTSPRNRTPFGNAVGAPPTSAPGLDERERAVADATCRAQAGLQAALRTEAGKLLDAWAAANPGITERLLSLRASMLARAGTLAGG